MVRVVRFPMRELLLLLLLLFVEVEVEFVLLLALEEGGESGCVGLRGVRLNDVNGEEGEK